MVTLFFPNHFGSSELKKLKYMFDEKFISEFLRKVDELAQNVYQQFPSTVANDSRKNRRQNLLTKHQHLSLRIGNYFKKCSITGDESAGGGLTEPSAKHDFSFVSNDFLK